MLNTNEDLHRFVKNNPELFSSNVLNPRDAFYGGRTNALKLYHKCGPGEQILYYDFCSLHPYMNKYARYPVGHPKKYVGDDECRRISLHDVEALVKCTVLPPEKLYHPLLLIKLRAN